MCPVFESSGYRVPGTGQKSVFEIRTSPVFKLPLYLAFRKVLDANFIQNGNYIKNSSHKIQLKIQKWCIQIWIPAGWLPEIHMLSVFTDKALIFTIWITDHLVPDINTVNVWIPNIWIPETFEIRTKWSPVFRWPEFRSGFQMLNFFD